MSQQVWKKLIGQNLKELRFVLCQTSQNSRGLRNWLDNNFVELKKSNPETLFLIRECENAEPTVLARYEYGIERKIICSFEDGQGVDKVIRTLVMDAEHINSNLI